MASEYTPKYIRREVWKRITSVIRDYRLLQADRDAVTATASNYTSKLKNELQRKITAFKAVYSAIDPDTRELVQERFWKHKAYKDIHLPMSERTMQRRVREFVVAVGRELGEI